MGKFKLPAIALAFALLAMVSCGGSLFSSATLDIGNEDLIARISIGDDASMEEFNRSLETHPIRLLGNITANEAGEIGKNSIIVKAVSTQGDDTSEKSLEELTGLYFTGRANADRNEITLVMGGSARIAAGSVGIIKAMIKSITISGDILSTNSNVSVSLNGKGKFRIETRHGGKPSEDIAYISGDDVNSDTTTEKLIGEVTYALTASLYVKKDEAGQDPGSDDDNLKSTVLKDQDVTDWFEGLSEKNIKAIVGAIAASGRKEITIQFKTLGSADSKPVGGKHVIETMTIPSEFMDDGIDDDIVVINPVTIVVPYASGASASVASTTISGQVGKDIDPVEFEITLDKAWFKAFSTGDDSVDMDVTDWFTGLSVAGLKAEIKGFSKYAGGANAVAVTISGKPSGVLAGKVNVVIDNIIGDQSVTMGNGASGNLLEFNIRKSPTGSITGDNVEIKGQVNSNLKNADNEDYAIRIEFAPGSGDVPASSVFAPMKAGEDISEWFVNLPEGLSVKLKSELVGTETNLTAEITGAPEKAEGGRIEVVIPGKAWKNGGNDLSDIDIIVKGTETQKWNIAADSTFEGGISGDIDTALVAQKVTIAISGDEFAEVDGSPIAMDTDLTQYISFGGHDEQTDTQINNQVKGNNGWFASDNASTFRILAANAPVAGDDGVVRLECSIRGTPNAGFSFKIKSLKIDSRLLKSGAAAEAYPKAPDRSRFDIAPCVIIIDKVISGTVGSQISSGRLTISLVGLVFNTTENDPNAVVGGLDVSEWFSAENKYGITDFSARVVQVLESMKTIIVEVTGTPSAANDSKILITIPSDCLYIANPEPLQHPAGNMSNFADGDVAFQIEAN